MTQFTVNDMRQLSVGTNDAGQRVDKFLLKSLVNIPKSLLYKFLRTKKIKLNGKRCEANEMIEVGDLFTLYISDEFFPLKDISGFEKYSLPHLTLDNSEIAYEDNNILVMDKKAGISVHQGSAEGIRQEKSSEIYLIDKMLGYLYKKGEYTPETENSFCPALCNRIDRNTAGLVIGAKNAEALRIMNQKIKDREMKKMYFCEVNGYFDIKSATLSDYLYKNSSENRVYIFKSKEQAKRTAKVKYDDDIKSVITKYKVMGECDGKSLLQVELVTGRTHQIRAHLAYYGHPLCGDSKYGKVHSKKQSDLHQALYSHSVEFIFSTDSGVLSYLNGKKIEGSSQPFMKKYGY
jgi:23S rRNA pseudouridine955/2504/2580 synthase